MYSLNGVEEGSEEKLILSGDEIDLSIPEEEIALPSGWAILPLTQLKVNICHCIITCYFTLYLSLYKKKKVNAVFVFLYSPKKC